jgi:pimeloyl-ACP methyl ester carboxylesterase
MPQEALTFVQNLEPQERGESLFFDYAEATLLAVTGAHQASLALLEELCAGEGWIDPALLLQDSDFQVLRDTHRFEDILGCFGRRMEADRERARVTKTVLYPASEPGGSKLLLVLHGDNSCASHTLESWSGAIDAGWTVVALQSAEAGSYRGAYRWHSYEMAKSAVEQVLASLLGDTAREGQVILAGFSRGGEVALRLALEGVGACRRAMAVCPAPVEEAGLLASAPETALRECYLFAGNSDPQRPSAERAIERLTSLGVSVRADLREGYGHEYPSDFSALLVGYLKEPEVLRS